MQVSLAAWQKVAVWQGISTEELKSWIEPLMVEGADAIDDADELQLLIALMHQSHLESMIRLLQALRDHFEATEQLACLHWWNQDLQNFTTSIQEMHRINDRLGAMLAPWSVLLLECVKDEASIRNSIVETKDESEKKSMF
jgi:hypothetical protein